MVNNKPSSIIPVIIGPTASGKSAYALDLARDLNGVVINCDAMQCYDCLHVLTAQPSQAEQDGIPHRLYAHLHPSVHYSATQWRDDAIREIETAWDNGQTPIICGGTGFYLKALMEGFSPIPDIPEDIRAQATALWKDLGTQGFFNHLQQHDPKTASQIDPMNPQRLIRAWEVFSHTNRPLADWQEEPLTGAPDGYQFHVKALFPEREQSIAKINKRLDAMLGSGALDEVKALDAMIQSGDVPEDALVIKAHGFRSFRKYLNGEWTLDQAINYTQTETRQYAKRQVTWLRHQLTIDELIEV